MRNIFTVSWRVQIGQETQKRREDTSVRTNVHCLEERTIRQKTVKLNVSE